MSERDHPLNCVQCSTFHYILFCCALSRYLSTGGYPLVHTYLQSYVFPEVSRFEADCMVPESWKALHFGRAQPIMTWVVMQIDRSCIIVAPMNAWWFVFVFVQDTLAQVEAENREKFLLGTGKSCAPAHAPHVVIKKETLMCHKVYFVGSLQGFLCRVERLMLCIRLQVRPVHPLNWDCGHSIWGSP